MKILISQKAPSNLSAYTKLQEKFGAEIDFKPFFLIEPLSEKDFRAKRINLQDYTAIVFSSRHAIDAYFALCAANKVKVPDTMKYFCTTELIANYLQKHIVFRKRKIFFGDGTPESIKALVGTKHKGEKFLVTTTEGSTNIPVKDLFEKAGIDCTVGELVRPVSQNLSGITLSDYNFIVLYNPSDVKSLQENFPDFNQGDIKFVSFGKSIVKAMEEAGLKIEIQGPTPEAPSAAMAIEQYLSRK